MIGNNIKRIREQKSISINELSRLSGVNASYISALERGKKNNPSSETLEKLADALEVSLDYLKGKSAKAIIEDKLIKFNMTIEELSKKSGVPKIFFDNLENIEPDELAYDHMNAIGRALNIPPRLLCIALSRQEPPVYEGFYSDARDDFDAIKDDKERFNICLEYNKYAKKKKKEEELKESVSIYDTINRDMSNIVNIPIVGVVRAGKPILVQENIEGYLPTLKRFLDTDKTYFYLKVKGDSMDQEFKEGSLLLIEKTPCIENGQIGVVLIDGMEATVKKVVKNDNMITLIPMSNNPDYVPKMFDMQKNKIQIIGVVKQATKIY